jgi:TolB-like protein/DNA-binding SARP family transcriptional activator
MKIAVLPVLSHRFLTRGTVFSLRVFGGLSLEGPDGPVAGRAAQRPQLALLVLLATAPNSGISREKLLAYLWPETDAERGRHLLSNAVYLLRQALGEDAIAGNRETLRLTPEAVRCDVCQFEQALEAGELERAVALYRGPFLDGFFLANTPEFERWMDDQRERHARSYAQAMEALAEAREGAGDWAGAAEWWRRLAGHDPCSSRIALRLMQALVAAGDPGGALRHGLLHQSLLQKELEVDPDAEVLALAERLREERTADPDESADSPAAPVAASGPPEAAAPGPRPSTPKPGDRARWGREAAVALTAATLLVLAVQGYRWYGQWDGGAEASLPVRSLAVLPLENLSGDPEQEFFADGMTDALITELARYGQLRVISRTSVMPYKNARAPLERIARELGVDAVVEGTVLRDGERVRIIAQLIDARSDEHLWANDYQGDLQDILALQREVARAIASAVRVILDPAAESRAARAQPVNRAAYDYYLRGRYYRKQVKAEHAQKAVELLEEAVALQPDFAAAHGELALAYAYIFSIFDPSRTDLLDKGFLAAGRALSLDPDQPDAHLARGRLLWTPASGWALARAAAEFERAIALDPSSYEARFQLGQLYLHMGLLDEALAEVERATAINPVDPRPRATAGQVLLYQMKPREALAALRETPPDLNPSHRAPHLAWALLRLGRHEEAQAVVDDALRRLPEDPNGTIAGIQAVLATAAGDHARAEASIRSAAENQRASIHFHHTEYSIGTAYALMGRADLAVEWLRSAAENGFPCYPLFAHDSALNALRHDPSFDALLAQLEAEYEAYRARFRAGQRESGPTGRASPRTRLPAR